MNESTPIDVIDTPRLQLRPLAETDAAFILELLNDPSWLRYIGDRGVRNLEDARNYVRNGPAAMRALHGFALDAVVDRHSGAPIGICGLLKRDTLEDVDLGFAFLPAWHGKGLAREAAAATLQHATGVLGIKRVVAITALDNGPSIRLLESIGFRFERILKMPGDADELRLFGYPARPTET